MQVVLSSTDVAHEPRTPVPPQTAPFTTTPKATPVTSPLKSTPLTSKKKRTKQMRGITRGGAITAKGETDHGPSKKSALTLEAMQWDKRRPYEVPDMDAARRLAAQRIFKFGLTEKQFAKCCAPETLLRLNEELLSEIRGSVNIEGLTLILNLTQGRKDLVRGIQIIESVLDSKIMGTGHEGSEDSAAGKLGRTPRSLRKQRASMVDLSVSALMSDVGYGGRTTGDMTSETTAEGIPIAASPMGLNPRRGRQSSKKAITHSLDPFKADRAGLAGRSAKTKGATRMIIGMSRTVEDVLPRSLPERKAMEYETRRSLESRSGATRSSKRRKHPGRRRPQKKTVTLDILSDGTSAANVRSRAPTTSTKLWQEWDDLISLDSVAIRVRAQQLMDEEMRTRPVSDSIYTSTMTEYGDDDESEMPEEKRSVIDGDHKSDEQRRGVLGRSDADGKSKRYDSISDRIKSLTSSVDRVLCNMDDFILAPSARSKSPQTRTGRVIPSHRRTASARVTGSTTQGRMGLTPAKSVGYLTTQGLSVPKKSSISRISYKGESSERSVGFEMRESYDLTVGDAPFLERIDDDHPTLVGDEDAMEEEERDDVIGGEKEETALRSAIFKKLHQLLDAAIEVDQREIVEYDERQRSDDCDISSMSEEKMSALFDGTELMEAMLGERLSESDGSTYESSMSRKRTSKLTELPGRLSIHKSPALSLLFPNDYYVDELAELSSTPGIPDSALRKRPKKSTIVGIGTVDWFQCLRNIEFESLFHSSRGVANSSVVTISIICRTISSLPLGFELYALRLQKLLIAKMISFVGSESGKGSRGSGGSGPTSADPSSGSVSTSMKIESKRVDMCIKMVWTLFIVCLFEKTKQQQRDSILDHSTRMDTLLFDHKRHSLLLDSQLICSKILIRFLCQCSNLFSEIVALDILDHVMKKWMLLRSAKGDSHASSSSVSNSMGNEESSSMMFRHHISKAVKTSAEGSISEGKSKTTRLLSGFSVDSWSLHWSLSSVIGCSSIFYRFVIGRPFSEQVLKEYQQCSVFLGWFNAAILIPVFGSLSRLTKAQESSEEEDAKEPTVSMKDIHLSESLIDCDGFEWTEISPKCSLLNARRLSMTPNLVGLKDLVDNFEDVHKSRMVMIKNEVDIEFLIRQCCAIQAFVNCMKPNSDFSDSCVLFDASNSLSPCFTILPLFRLFQNEDKASSAEGSLKLNLRRFLECCICEENRKSSMVHFEVLSEIIERECWSMMKHKLIELRKLIQVL